MHHAPPLVRQHGKGRSQRVAIVRAQGEVFRTGIGIEPAVVVWQWFGGVGGAMQVDQLVFSDGIEPGFERASRELSALRLRFEEYLAGRVLGHCMIAQAAEAVMEDRIGVALVELGEGV